MMEDQRLMTNSSGKDKLRKLNRRSYYENYCSYCGVWYKTFKQHKSQLKHINRNLYTALLSKIPAWEIRTHKRDRMTLMYMRR